MSEQESLTYAELAGALNRVKGLPLGIDMDVLARDLYADIKAHREYEPGTVVLDACGDVFRRFEYADRPWVGFTGQSWPEDHPVHPLRRLVPEGSLAAKLSYEDVLDELALGMEHEEDHTQLATRIMKLLDGAQ